MLPAIPTLNSEESFKIAMIPIASFLRITISILHKLSI